MRLPETGVVSTPLSPTRGKGGKSGGRDNAEEEGRERKTSIQVCVRVRPILASDAPSRHHPRGGSATSSRIPTPPGKGKKGTRQKSDLVRSRVAHYARLTESSQHRLDGEEGGGGGSSSAAGDSASAASVASASTLIPAWEVACSKPRPSTAAWDSESDPIPDSDKDKAAARDRDDTIFQSPSTNPDPARKSSYNFDRVFGPSTRTSSIYSESVRDVVTASMEGYHGSVFAYGQTSTGKTHTMTGTPADPGIVPLAVRDCFRHIRSSEASADREYLLRVSYMEIYNEQINDLLAHPSGPVGPRSASASSSFSTSGGSASGVGVGAGGSSAIRIFESKTEGVVVRGLREEVVTSPEQVFALLATGEARRRTGSTALNRASSRSHSIFRLIVESRARRGVRRSGQRDESPASTRGDSDVDSASTSDRDSSGGPVRVSSLSLVDLAGSESVKATGSTGARQKEGQFINKSLLTLGHVVHKLSEISAKTERECGGGLDPKALTKHIPYRDSKLTRLLQPSLSGNAQICIICNVSPLSRNLDESHNTLKFASRAKKIKQSASINEVLDDRTLLQNYREEIEALKAQLREAKEAQVALQKEKEENAGRGSAESAATSAPPTPVALDDDEDVGALVEAIQNLEKLILKKSSTGSAGAAAKSKTRKGVKKAVGGGTGSFFSNGGFETLLSDEDDGDEELITTPSKDVDRTLFPAEENNAAGMAGAEIAIENGVTHEGSTRTPTKVQGGEEEDGLIEELHRIQGLLGSVLKKKGGGGADLALPNAQSPVGMKSSAVTPIEPIPNGSSALHTPTRDDEVELLRSQLKEQEVATSLRKADSSFLESQLQEKDNLLKEVSKILDAVEKRQVELEIENTRMKEDLSRKSLLLESREAEILNLKRQIAEQDDKMFSDLVG